MIYSMPDYRRPFVPPPDRNPLPFAPRPGPAGGFEGFDLLGTAHFTRKSIGDAVAAASSGRYSSVALELDRRRFDALNAAPYRVPYGPRGAVEGEFVAASDALGNHRGDVWLIDISLERIRARIGQGMTLSEARDWDRVSAGLEEYESAGIRLWESGDEREAMRYLGLTSRAMEKYAPTLHRVLIEERNAIMAARLLEIAGQAKGKVLVLVGKAHVKGMVELLSDGRAVGERLRSFGLAYSPPVRVRRVEVN